VDHALDRQRILIAHQIKGGEIGRGRGHGHSDATPRVADAADAAIRAKPCSRSQIRSSIDSVPTDSRMVPGPTPAARSSSSLSCRCVVLAGWMMRLLESPTLARCDHNVTPRMKYSPAVRPRRHSNENTAPAPRGRYLSDSARQRLAWRPGSHTD